MNPGLSDYYNTCGLPATATVTIPKVPTAGTTITVNGVVFTYGSNGFTGRTREEVAQYLAAGVNADRNKQDRHTNTNPISAVYAMHYGNVVRLIATEPGVAGNSLTLATSVATEFVLSGATFSGGTAPTATGPAQGVSAKEWVELTHTTEATTTPKRLSATSLACRRALIEAPVANTQNVTIGPNSAGTSRTLAPGSGDYLVEAAPGTTFDLTNWYSKPATAAAQTLNILYQPA